jgi:leucine dehydrogenase
MNLLGHPEFKDHEQVVYCYDPATRLKAIIAIHSTVLGPSLGGTRMWKYQTENDALTDVLRLSRGMTYKASVAGLDLGGGKAVIIGDPNNDKTPELFLSYGRYLDTLGGRYITSKDVGTTVEDLEIIRSVTKHVTGIEEVHGGSGDPSPMTGYGVYVGIKACLKELTGNDSLTGKKVAVQGAGSVAMYLCELLSKEGAKIFVTDIQKSRADDVIAKHGGTFVAPDKIYDVDAEIFSPCAMGAIVNDETIPRLRSRIIAGGANNQLADEQKHGRMLRDRGILYAPDYVINAGGLINVADELHGYDRARAKAKTSKIYDTLLEVFAIARNERISTHEASNHVAENRIAMKAKKG